MPSSISNSNFEEEWPETYWKRPIPTAHWQGASLLTLVLVIGFMVFWETYWRAEGYEPSYEDTKDLWAARRAEVGPGKENFVLIGSSRMNFDVDLNMWEQDFGGRRPIMLARPGVGPRHYLTDLANEESFDGTVICGVTPILFFAPGFLPPVQMSGENVEYYQKWSPVQKSGYLLSMPLQSAFASLNGEDLALGKLVRQRILPMKNRMSPLLIPPMPPYFAKTDGERRAHMWAKMERDEGLQQFVQQIWIPHWLHTPTLEGEGLDALLGRIKGEVEQIQSRGGQVVFLYLPFSGGLVEPETTRWPRETYWNRLVSETGALGIHFEDYEELSGFECPEWSHLSRSDAVLFTHGLTGIVKKMVDVE